MTFQERSMTYLQNRINELSSPTTVNGYLSFDVEKIASNTGKIYVRDAFDVVATINFNFQYDSATFEFKLGNIPNKHVIGDSKGDLTLSLNYHDSHKFPDFAANVVFALNKLGYK